MLNYLFHWMGVWNFMSSSNRIRAVPSKCYAIHLWNVVSAKVQLYIGIYRTPIADRGHDYTLLCQPTRKRFHISSQVKYETYCSTNLMILDGKSYWVQMTNLAQGIGTPWNKIASSCTQWHDQFRNWDEVKRYKYPTKDSMCSKNTQADELSNELCVRTLWLVSKCATRRHWILLGYQWG